GSASRDRALQDARPQDGRVHGRATRRGAAQGGRVVRASADALRGRVSAMVRAGGSADGEAALVAEHLVAANLAGHDSHGVGMMPSYVRHLKAGLLVPNTKAKVVKDDGPALMFDGGRGYGRSVAGESIA